MKKGYKGTRPHCGLQKPTSEPAIFIDDCCTSQKLR